MLQERVRRRAQRSLDDYEDGQTVGAGRHVQVVSKDRHYWSVYCLHSAARKLLSFRSVM